MGKFNELKTTTDLVKDILRKYPQTRNSDNELYFRVCAELGKQKGINIHTMSMPAFFLHMKDYGFPATESVRRARQKLQAEYPELAAVPEVEGQRNLNEKDFRNYARGCV